MSKPRQSPTRRRIVLRCAQAILWPIAWLLPGSGWARLHRRLCELDGRRPPPRVPARARTSRPLMGFIVLLAMAFVVWLHDVLRRPEPPAVHHGTAVSAPARR
jgi:hypothetical protein